ncbi:unnamed protein product [Ceratitis capitata]|uniref:(Mediterranean fruit fly) hypothetical protein n=1 Tax=Ceratitis capitata TaxID=7213 RepID=A0A811U1C5_CERCA|nr:unnamed protein product [Ceratitis capitata]
MEQPPAHRAVANTTPHLQHSSSSGRAQAGSTELPSWCTIQFALLLRSDRQQQLQQQQRGPLFALQIATLTLITRCGMQRSRLGLQANSSQASGGVYVGVSKCTNASAPSHAEQDKCRDEPRYRAEVCISS